MARHPVSAVVAAVAIAVLSGCERRPDDTPVTVSVIGGPAKVGDTGRSPSPASRLLLTATAQGLVRFDTNGGIEPGLAERWIVIDNGRSFIFRLRDAEWADGTSVTANDVVKALRRNLARRDNPLAPYLTAVDEVVAMTPQVIEVRLKRPRPDLLKLFAQPELAIFMPGGAGGSGPFRVQAVRPSGLLLRPAFDPSRSPDDEPGEPRPEEFIDLRGERAAVAIARFASKGSDLVDGGGLDDWPIVRLAGIPPANVRVDVAAGLFGLSFVHRDGFLADPRNRAAVALAIDRQAVAGSLADNWPAIETVLPDRLDSAAAPTVPDWASVPPGERIATARARVALWQADRPGPIRLRIALPSGPGGTMLWGQLGVMLRRANFSPERVGLSADADLRLVDQVAPYDSARWYLRTACQPCGQPVAAAIVAAREAPDLPTRAAHLAAADAALAADVAFVPITKPLRWSLVARRLRAWTPNARAFHPLNHLRPDPK